MTRLCRLFTAWLARREIGLWLAILAVLIMLPSVWGGFAADDHFLRLVLSGSEELPEFRGSHHEAFVFGRGDKEVNLQRMGRGVFPWWTAPEGRLAFWRPLASLSHWFDFQWFPNTPALMHLHSLLWYAAVALAATALYRRLVHPAWVAGLAALLYVMDDAHSFAVGWLSNRNSVMATLFGILALLSHDRWRRDNWRPGLALGIVFLAMGLCCAEAAMAVCGYLAAYALFLDRGPWRVRPLTLLPYAALVLPWLVVYKHLGFGTTGSGLYTDPFSEPLLFLHEAPQRLAVLLLGQLGTPTSSLWVFYPEPWGVVQILVAIVFVGFVLWTLWPILRTEALARFWLLGMVISLLPFCATFPNDRHLFFAGLGGMGLVARFFQAWLGSAPEDRALLSKRRYSAPLLGVCWLAVHCVFSPLWTPASSLTIAGVDGIVDEASESLPHSPETRELDVVVINAPSDFLSFYVPIQRAAENEPIPRHAWTLSAGIEAVHVTRSGERSLLLRVEGGFLPAGWSRMFRSPAYAFHQGETIELAGLQANIHSVTEDGRPVEVEFTFDRSLDDPAYRFFTWSGQEYEAFKVPGVGETVSTPAMPWTWFLE